MAIYAKGKNAHALTKITESIATEGFPSQEIGLPIKPVLSNA